MNLIIPDKFRGTMSASTAAKAIAEGFGGNCRCMPMADGGEGTAEALPDLLVVESASVIGHANKALLQTNLMKRSSYDLGMAIDYAIKRNNGTIMVAVGGTVTADGGAGLLQALGVRFFDSSGREFTTPLCPDDIHSICSVDISALESIRQRIFVLSDVEAALTDSDKLSALDFVKQKGATEDQHTEIAQALKHLQSVLGGQSQFDGAGGGIGYALAAVAGCNAMLGADFILNHLPVDWTEINLVATGEGCIDRQSIGGKVVGRVLERCQKAGIPAVAFGGRVAPEVTDIRCIEVSPVGKIPTPKEAYKYLKQAAEKFIEKQSRIRY